MKKVKSVVAGCAFLAGLSVWGATAAEQALAERLPAIFARCSGQYRTLLAAMEREKPDCFPKRFQDGRLATIGPVDWCSGLFPGSLWYLYEATRDGFWERAARAYTERLIEPLRHDASNHDVGFRTYCSAGQAWRLTGEKRYAEFLHDTAAALRTRYDAKLKLIRSWDSRQGGRYNPNFMVIIDNMMNLELLEWDAKNGGDPLSHEIACHQADSTDRHHFRPDSSAYHVLSYDRETGKIQAAYGGQGACVEGTWSRGHAWAIYGFAMMYRETKNPRYLSRAIRAADYWLEEPRLPADLIAYWDFKAPQIPDEPRDASASAVVASALLELADFAPGFKGRAYREAAVKMLLSLSSDAYFARPGENGGFLLKHSVGFKPGGSEVDVPLNYADYYFLEALVRFRARRARGGAPRPQVDACHLPERMDDFCWENPFCGMRAYGPKLAQPAPVGQGLSTCGFDVFNKGVGDVVLAETIRRSLAGNVSYHAPNGRCFDSYKVSLASGCGGLLRRGADGVWRRDGNWRSARVLEKTADRAVFELVYDSAVLRGTVTAETPFVRFEAERRGPAAPGELWGTGLDLSAARGHDGVQKIDQRAGFAANGEPATGNWTMSAVVIDPSCGPARVMFDETGCVCLMVGAETKLVFYVGAAWGGAGVFPTAEKWFEHVRLFAQGLKR